MSVRGCRERVKAERVALMPDWPARMGEDLAALYLGVSQSGFRLKVATRAYPQPVREGGRMLWSRRQLDRYVESQFGIAPTDEGDPTWADFK